jgi:hypothetical protein
MFSPVNVCRMTDSASVPGSPNADSTDGTAWLRAISAALAAVGLSVDESEPKDRLAVTATFRRPGRKETDVIIGEDGHAELHWWLTLGTAPELVTTAIVRAISAVTAVPPIPAPSSNTIEQPAQHRPVRR